jgi:vanillate O-demethylase ferredoxin subunit
MCGPIRLMDAVGRKWEAAALPPVNLRFETFGSRGWFQPEEFVV